MSIKAKFKVCSIHTHSQHGNGINSEYVEVTLNQLPSGTGSEETDKLLWQDKPLGTLKLTVLSKDAFALFARLGTFTVSLEPEGGA